MLQPEHAEARSQDLEPAYHDAGQWYWMRVARFLAAKELMGPNCAGLELPELEAQGVLDGDLLRTWALLPRAAQEGAAEASGLEPWQLSELMQGLWLAGGALL